MAGVLLAILLLLTFVAIPRWNYSNRWGWAPSGTLAAVFLIAATAFIVGWI
jgi:hypothetical protein